MSCFVVDNAHISVLVNAARQYDLLGDQSLADLGQKLLVENQASYAWRYPHFVAEDRDELERRYVLDTTEALLHPYAVAKAARCYEYQSCEHPDWRNSAARQFVRDLVAAVESTLSAEEMTPTLYLPGRYVRRYTTSKVYESVPWEFTSLEDAKQHNYPAT